MSSVHLTRVVGPACVQDLGRVGQLVLGLPRGGTLAPARLRALNLALSNAPDAAGLEVFGSLILEVAQPTRIAVDGAPVELVNPGTARVIAAEGRRLRIVAIEGGIDVPEVLGGRGLLPHARIGGHEGRWLRTGDVLPLGPHTATGVAPGFTSSIALPSTPQETLPVRVFPGPQAAALAYMDSLYSATFRLATTSDRTGVRLEGSPFELAARDPRAPSLPLVPGAVQVPPSGLPIILGPDHPVSGGYPVVAVVAQEALEPLFVAPLGTMLRFVPAG